jgi:hypothetical protein
MLQAVLTNMTTIKELTDEYEALEAKIDAWFKAEIQPQLDACTSIEEIGAIKRKLTYEARSEDNQVRGLPSTMEVSFIFAFSRFTR